MTPEQIDEARRWVTLPGWRWMPGMLTVGRLRILRVDSDGYAPGYREGAGYIDALGGDSLPDVTDSATRGCLLALAREITGRPDMSVMTHASGGRRASWWRHGMISPDGHFEWTDGRDTETAALLAAVEDYYRAKAHKET